MTKDTISSFSLLTGMAITMIAGGTSLPSHENFLFICILNLGLLTSAAWQLRNTSLHTHALRGVAILCCAISLMSFQLIPLPQALWSNIAGRQIVSEIFALTPLTDAWMPLSLSPSATRADILSLLPGIATFAVALTLSQKQQFHIAAMIVAVALLNMLVGLSQEPKTSGFFVNQNFYAAFLYSAIGFIFYLAQPFAKKSRWAVPLAIMASLLVLAAIGATGSRFSLILAVALVGGCCMATSTSAKSKSAFVIIFALLLVSMAILGGAGLSRMTELQSAMDFRSTIFSTSFQAASVFFPFGSGFGSFVPVYQLFETPSTLQPVYINHAHNDWLEVVIEGGLPALILCLAFLWWFAGAATAAWTETAPNSLARFASLSLGALLLHSLFDYPLRTASLMSVFGVCSGVLAVSARKHAVSEQPKFKFESVLP